MEDCRPESSASFHDNIERSLKMLEIGDKNYSCPDKASDSDEFLQSEIP